MITSTRKALVIGMVSAMLAVTLSACGGGGSNDPVNGPPPPPPESCGLGDALSAGDICGYGDMLTFNIGDDGTIGDGVTCDDDVCADDDNNFQAAMVRDGEWRISAIPREDDGRISTPFTYAAATSETDEFRAALASAADQAPNHDLYSIVMDSKGSPLDYRTETIPMYGRLRLVISVLLSKETPTERLRDT